MCSFQSTIKNLKTIGTNQEMAIYNGFASQSLLLCVFHLLKSDERKILQLNPQKGASRKIIANIYGCQYGGIVEYGLADSTDKEDLEARLRSMEEQWELLCPGFYKWFSEKCKPIFESSVIDSTRKPTNVQGLYCNNTIEAQHFCQKNEQSFKAGIISEIVGTLKTLTERQQNDKVRALYGSGPYYLSQNYRRFQVDSVQWHSMNAKKKMKHVEDEVFLTVLPSLDKHFPKPSTSG